MKHSWGKRIHSTVQPNYQDCYYSVQWMYTFINSTQLRDKDHLSVLQTVVVDRVSHKWRGIATFLNFSINKMESIEHDAGKEKRDIMLKDVQ